MTLIPNGRMIFAHRRIDRAWVGVLDVRNGLSCDCICPECSAPLQARQGPIRRAYFAHAPGAAGCGMGWWHTVIRDSIAELRLIDLGRTTAIPRLRGQQRIVRAGREEQVLDGEFQLDVILWLQSGLKIAVEVVDTCDIEGIKFVALEQEGFQVLRIDVAAVQKAMQRLPATAENLKALLASSGGWQSWPQVRFAPVQEPLPLTQPWLASAYRAVRSFSRGLQSERTAWSNRNYLKGECRESKA